MKNMTIGFAVTGSFCTIADIYRPMEDLVLLGYNVLPILSFNVASMDTRFGKAKDMKEKMIAITGNTPIETISGAEPIGPKKLLDALIVCPCTGNTLAKLANAITDTPVTMACKAHLRNERPLIISVSSNDALSTNAKNIGELLNMKNTYFVPFGQDNPQNKTNSLVADLKMVVDTLKLALDGKQIQPILL